MSARNALIGSAVERLEDLRLLRGKGIFVDDLVLDGLLHAAILRSPVAHGRIRAIDAKAALALPGVRAVVTGADMGKVRTIPLRLIPLEAMRPFEQPVIAWEKVRYVGEPIAVVLADSAALAEDALDRIALDIEPLPVVSDRRIAGEGRALLFEAQGTNLAMKFTAFRGNANEAFKRADYVRRERFSVHRHTAVTMESRGVLASWDEDKRHLTVFGAAKVPFFNRRILAGLMDLAEDSITMIENDVGGGFGNRGEFYPEDFLIPFAARHVRRPVKWIEDRREHLIAANHARECDCEIEIACRKDGTILALRGHQYADMGAYVRTNGAVGPRNGAQFLSGPYRIPDIDIDVELLVTNKTPVGTYRGPGRFEGDFFRERLLDMVARDLGIDPVAFRRRNLVAGSRDSLQDRERHAVRRRYRIRQRRLSHRARSLPRGIRLGGETASPRQADRRALSRAGLGLLHRRRGGGTQGDGAARARPRRHGDGVGRLRRGRTGIGDRVRADRGRRA